MLAVIQIFPQFVYCNEEAGKFEFIFGWTSHYALISRFYCWLIYQNIFQHHYLVLLLQLDGQKKEEQKKL